jgi:hypothetical protein
MFYTNGRFGAPRCSILMSDSMSAMGRKRQSAFATGTAAGVAHVPQSRSGLPQQAAGLGSRLSQVSLGLEPSHRRLGAPGTRSIADQYYPSSKQNINSLYCQQYTSILTYLAICEIVYSQLRPESPHSEDCKCKDNLRRFSERRICAWRLVLRTADDTPNAIR